MTRGEPERAKRGVASSPRADERLSRETADSSLPIPLVHAVFAHTNTNMIRTFRFAVASELCGAEFMAALSYIVESDLEARIFVEDALKVRNGERRGTGASC